MGKFIDNDLFDAVPIIGISRHRLLTDGEGITTLVAFHGCPLNCVYCLNPRCNEDEGIDRWITPKSLYYELKRDDFYFRTTNGGVCFGGGEPLLRYDFIKKFKTICGNKWKIIVETSLNIPLSFLQEVSSCIDEYIIDIKDMSESVYKDYTKVDNSNVVRNLQYLVQKGVEGNVTIRIPLIPGFNTEQDIDHSINIVKDLGFNRVDKFCYIAEKIIEEKATRIFPGKMICEELKRIRSTIAESNGIDYIPANCTYKGDCIGTCPKCEQELRYISEILWERERQSIAIST